MYGEIETERDRERPKGTKETVETVETTGDMYMQIQIVWRDRERPKETKETVQTVETSGGTCKYKIV